MSTEHIPLVVSQTTTPELAAYYSNRPQVWRNIWYLMSCRVGWDIVYNIVTPLILLRLSSVGVSTGTIGLINSINFSAMSVLVMYFSWRSDHTVSRFGRRLPYLLVSAPFIIVTTALFPFFKSPTLLIIFYVVQILFMNLKNSTFALIPIDITPRAELARFQSLYSIIGGVVTFISFQWGFRSTNVAPWLPYIAGATIMIITTWSGMQIHEPPIQAPTKEKWMPWITLAVGFRDRRMILLMIAVAMTGTFSRFYESWMWLFVGKQLGFDVKTIGPLIAAAALTPVLLAWPVGWLIDKVGGLKVSIGYVFLMLGTCYLITTAQTRVDIIWMSVAATIASILSTSPDMIILKLCPVKDVGSITSSSSFIRCIYVGIMICCSGYLVDFWEGNYRLVFVIGMLFSVIGLILMFVYRGLMDKGGAMKTDPSA